MSDFIQWLDYQATKIKNGIERSHKFSNFIGKVDNEKERINRTETFFLFEDDYVKPISKESKEIHYTISEDWHRLYEDGYYINWTNLINKTIEEQNKGIIDMLSEDSKKVEIDNFDVSLILDEFAEWYPDTVLVNPLHIKHLRKIGDFALNFNVEGNRYGRLSYLDVYFCSGVDVNEFLVYEKRNTELYMTPLKVWFTESQPRELVIAEKYVAWNVVPGSLVRFKLVNSSSLVSSGA